LLIQINLRARRHMNLESTYLTPLAFKKLPLARAVLSEGNEEALKGFTDREITTLSKLLLRVVRNLDPEIAAEIESMQPRKPSIRHRI
jgi:hypothetical protein